VSATRGGVGPEVFFPTPDWAIDAILTELPLGGTLVDAGCGDGAILSRVALVAPATSWLIGVELDDKLVDAARSRLAGDHRVRIVQGDYLAVGPGCLDQADSVIANTPFSLAESFLERSLALVAPSHGTVALLLRHDWGVANIRADLIERTRPDVHPLSRRPRFRAGKDGRLGGDSCEYAWYAWGPGRCGRWKPLRCAPARPARAPLIQFAKENTEAGEP
jgi:SAM-dependent methyltransferase